MIVINISFGLEITFFFMAITGVKLTITLDFGLA
jgi:hypothetical protein